jgi:uncharacterized protein YutE (UPF0331/DUF86 family)
LTVAGLSRGQRRIGVILRELPAAREQLWVAMETVGPDFEEQRFLAAALSPDAQERNKVTVIERLYEMLLNWLHELAARGLAEGQRLGVVDKTPGHPWLRLAELGVISHESARRLRKAKELRDLLAHAYPPADWRDLHDGVLVLTNELDRYLVAFRRWIFDEGIMPSSRP